MGGAGGRPGRGCWFCPSSLCSLLHKFRGLGSRSLRGPGPVDAAGCGVLLRGGRVRRAAVVGGSLRGTHGHGRSVPLRGRGAAGPDTPAASRSPSRSPSRRDRVAHCPLPYSFATSVPAPTVAEAQWPRHKRRCESPGGTDLGPVRQGRHRRHGTPLNAADRARGRGVSAGPSGYLAPTTWGCRLTRRRGNRGCREEPSLVPWAQRRAHAGTFRARGCLLRPARGPPADVPRLRRGGARAR